MTIGSIIVLIAIIVAVFFAMRSMIRDLKNGENCTTCTSGCSYDAQGHKVCTAADKMMSDVEKQLDKSGI